MVGDRSRKVGDTRKAEVYLDTNLCFSMITDFLTCEKITLLYCYCSVAAFICFVNLFAFWINLMASLR